MLDDVWLQMAVATYDQENMVHGGEKSNIKDTFQEQQQPLSDYTFPVWKSVTCYYNPG